MSTIKSAACGAAALLFATVAAQAESLVCLMDTPENSWITQHIKIDLTGGRAAQVTDAITMHFQGGPAEGRVATNNARRLTVTWNVEGTTSRSSQRADLRYTAFISKPSLEIDVVVTPHGYDNRHRGVGRCKMEG